MNNLECVRSIILSKKYENVMSIDTAGDRDITITHSPRWDNTDEFYAMLKQHGNPSVNTITVQSADGMGMGLHIAWCEKTIINHTPGWIRLVSSSWVKWILAAVFILNVFILSYDKLIQMLEDSLI
jgi:hypothetical protein